MYVPKHFAEERLDVLHAAMREAEFGTLVTLTPTTGTARWSATSPAAMHSGATR